MLNSGDDLIDRIQSWFIRLVRPTAYLGIAIAILVAVDTSLWGGQPEAANPPKFELRTARGKVVWLADALARLHGVKTVPEARERTLALETADGELFPIVEDARGRAFRKDERLRHLPLEILARKHAGSPMLQVIKLFEVRGDKRLVIDYWCEICAISMIELKDCDCCQGPIELRKREE